MAHSSDTTMTFHLKVGILQPDSAWTPLLSQIGLDVETANLEVANPVQRYSVLVVNGKPDRNTLQALHSYHEQGGAILDTGPYLHYREGNEFVDTYISQILPDPHERFHYVGRIDLHQKVRLYQQGQYLNDTVYLSQTDEERIAYLGWNLEQAFSDTGYIRKSFYSGDGHTPNEIVSKVTRSPIRRTVTEILKYLHHARGLPFLYLWPFPEGKQRFFSFRIDSDYGNRESVSALHDMVVQHQLSTTWFLHVEAHRDWLDYFHSFEDNQEIAVHGYQHQTYSGYDRNYRNIQQAVQVLEEKLFNCRGFCAPYGLWNRKLQQVIEDLQFDYSSEFCYDYDNYPSFPYKEGNLSPVVQVPIHPIGIGRLQHSGATNPQILSYFKQVIEHQASRLEPIILYHHPQQAGNKIFSKLFNQMDRRETCNWTMGAYARWWKERHNLRFEATLRNGRIHVSSRQPSSSQRAVVFVDSKRYSILSFNTAYTIDQLPFSTFKPATPPAVEKGMSEFYYNFRLLKTSCLDFIHRLGS